MQENSEPDWHLQAWAARLGKSQSDLVRELNWHKNTAHKVWHSTQPYKRALVNELSRWLGLEPFELLMPPDLAMAYRQFQHSATAIAAESQRHFTPAPRKPDSEK